MTNTCENKTIVEDIRRTGFSRVPAAEMAVWLAKFGTNDWNGFAKSWNDLHIDPYMADGGTYRRRRHAVVTMSGGDIGLQPHQPHYQSLDYNRLNGGIERWFEPIMAHIMTHPVMIAVLKLCADIFKAASKPQDWRIELHQFRIEAGAETAGQPTPEGIHRDGVDWAFVMLIERENAISGITSIHSPDHLSLGQFTLSTPMDAVFLDDHRVFHGVTPIYPENEDKPAHRDVLVVTFTAA